MRSQGELVPVFAGPAGLASRRDGRTFQQRVISQMGHSVGMDTKVGIAMLVVGRGRGLYAGGYGYLAERVGFEPTVATRATTVFETVPFNHSGTSPKVRGDYNLQLNARMQFRVEDLPHGLLLELPSESRGRLRLTMHEEHLLDILLD